MNGVSDVRSSCRRLSNDHRQAFNAPQRTVEPESVVCLQMILHSVWLSSREPLKENEEVVIAVNGFVVQMS